MYKVVGIVKRHSELCESAAESRALRESGRLAGIASGMTSLGFVHMQLWRAVRGVKGLTIDGSLLGAGVEAGGLQLCVPCS